MPFNLPVPCVSLKIEVQRTFPPNLMAKTGELFSTEWCQKNDELYPLRWFGNPTVIRSIDERSICGKRVSADISPFLSLDITAAQRGELYSKNLRAEEFTQSDLSSVKEERACEEKKLIGQNKLVAARHLREGDCLGVYAGEIVLDYWRGAWTRAPFNLATGEPEFPAVFGDGMLSRANTTFRLENDGTYHQVKSGYALEAAAFSVTVDRLGRAIHGLPAQIPIEILAFFTTRDVSPGEELRWNYQYSPKYIDMMLNDSGRSSVVRK